MNKIRFDHRDAWTDPAAAFGVNRRRFMTNSVAVGFALAAQPVLADAIHTDEAGLIAGQVMVPVAGGDIPAYRAFPDKGGPFPVILVVHEIFGVHEYIQDVVRRLAKLGYYAIAADLYSRQGDVSKMASVRDIIEQVVAKVPDQQFLSDLDSTVAYSAKTGKADVSRLGITGFCWGGRATWLYSAHNPAVTAAVAWYGPLTGDDRRPGAIQLAGRIKTPVLGLYAGKDGNITAADVAAMRAALQGGNSEIIVYPEANHGFHADYRPSYDEGAAKDGWQRLQAWFKKNGVA
jgi:carboxymethylenebutenolidase